MLYIHLKYSWDHMALVHDREEVEKIYNVPIDFGLLMFNCYDVQLKII
jgi:hypothetical protein